MAWLENMCSRYNCIDLYNNHTCIHWDLNPWGSKPNDLNILHTTSTRMILLVLSFFGLLAGSIHAKGPYTIFLTDANVDSSASSSQSPSYSPSSSSSTMPTRSLTPTRSSTPYASRVQTVSLTPTSSVYGTPNTTLATFATPVTTNTNDTPQFSPIIIALCVIVSMIASVLMVGIAIQVMKPKTPLTSTRITNSKKGRKTTGQPTRALPSYTPIQNSY